MTEEQIKSLQSTGGDHLAATEKNILGNNLNSLWDHVGMLREKNVGRIDFVLDNAGFELYCDCVYGNTLFVRFGIIANISHAADFLLQSGIAKEIRFHGKRYPWFVSDVTKKDWEWLLNSMVYGQLFPNATDIELESLRRLGQRWKVNRNDPVEIWSHAFYLSNMKRKANGSTSSIPSGVQATPSGSSILRRRTYFFTFLIPTWSSLKVISTTVSSLTTVQLQPALPLTLQLALWRVLRVRQSLLA